MLRIPNSLFVMVITIHFRLNILLWHLQDNIGKQDAGGNISTPEGRSRAGYRTVQPSGASPRSHTHNDHRTQTLPTRFLEPISSTFGHRKQYSAVALMRSLCILRGAAVIRNAVVYFAFETGLHSSDRRQYSASHEICK
jgi:hypothetical protein